MMAKVVIRQFRMFVGLADIYRHPLGICVKCRPTMVTADDTRIAVGRNGKANGESGGNVDGTAKRNEVGVEIRAVAGACVSCIKRIAATPALAALIIAHAPKHMLIQCLASCKIVREVFRGFAGKRNKART